MILTTRHRLKDAIRFKNYNGNNCWMLLGGTAAWPNDAAPPTPSNSLTSVVGLFAAKKASVKWVYEDASGSIEFTDPDTEETVKFSEATSEDSVKTNSASIILMEASVLSSQLAGIDDFRIIAFATGLVPVTGHEADTFLEVANIDDPGDIETIEYRVPYNVEPGETYRGSNLIEY